MPTDTGNTDLNKDAILINNLTHVLKKYEGSKLNLGKIASIKVKVAEMRRDFIARRKTIEKIKPRQIPITSLLPDKKISVVLNRIPDAKPGPSKIIKNTIKSVKPKKAEKKISIPVARKILLKELKYYAINTKETFEVVKIVKIGKLVYVKLNSSKTANNRLFKINPFYKKK